jgi:hypothetical protein
VLIIDKLPVPLHVFLKTLRDLPDGSAFSEMKATIFGQNRIKMKKDCFPSRYHSHPYWNTDKYTYFVGQTDNMRQTMDLLASQLTLSSIDIRKCKVCMADRRTKLYRCGKCRADG